VKWYDAPIVVVDFETTGFRPPRCIIEVGAVRYERGEEVDRLECLVKPMARIEKGATEVHGLSDADVFNQPTFRERYEALRGFFRGAVPASYGAYDQRVLHEELERMRKTAAAVDEQIPAFSLSWGPWLDVLGWARELYPIRGKGRHKLANVASYYEIELRKEHRAIDDAVAAAQLLWHWHNEGWLPDVGIAEMLATKLPG
jgi:DNA polymerase III epsilon subunit-like protein